MNSEKLIHQSIIDQCRENNAKAQMQLYNLYCKAMFVVARRYMKDDLLAEDMMQEAFIKAFKKIQDYKGEVAFGAWLKRIVINRCIDELKRKKLELISITNESKDLVDDEQWQVADETTVSQVMHCINSLKEKYRVVVSLYLLEGYDHQEISEILGISEVASRTHLLRGKKIVLESLKTLGYAEGY